MSKNNLKHPKKNNFWNIWGHFGLKYNRSADAAIEQIKVKRYAEALKEYFDEVVLVEINYDKESKQYECIIEKIHFAPQNAPQNITERQERILQLIRTNPRLSKGKIAERLGLSYDIVKRDMAAMNDVVKYVGLLKKGNG